MGSTRDFVAATVADQLLPWFRRPVEDVIYETIDRRQIPTRTDFKELRDLVNNLRGQLTGATGGVKRLAETTEELDDRIADLEERFAALEARLAEAESATGVSAAEVDAKLAALEARLSAAAPAPAPASSPAPPAATPAPAAASDAGCQVPDCGNKVRARGFCARHYQQWRRNTLDGFPNPEA